MDYSLNVPGWEVFVREGEFLLLHQVWYLPLWFTKNINRSQKLICEVWLKIWVKRDGLSGI